MAKMFSFSYPKTPKHNNIIFSLAKVIDTLLFTRLSYFRFG
jgi:hypothetical protein